jgi:hypothetical protein
VCRLRADEGSEPYLSQLQRGCIARAAISLRVGAQVMLLKVPPPCGVTAWCNAPAQNISVAEGLVNGSRGVVVRFAAGNNPVVKARVAAPVRPALTPPPRQFVSGVERVVAAEKWAVDLAGITVAVRAVRPVCARQCG